LTFQRVAGGTGSDTLRLDGGGLTLNLTTLKDNRLLGIEQIDITGTGNNMLTLSLRDVLNLSDESNTLTILRNSGDIVNFGTGWTRDPQLVVVDDLSFEVLTQGAASLLIQDPSFVIGTANNDDFVLTYSGTSTTGTVNIMRSTNGGVAVDLGTLPMNAPVTLRGLAGSDSVQVVGTAGTDEYVISSSGRLTINGSVLVFESLETTNLVGAAGDDDYRFDADTALDVYTLDESGGGIDTIDLSSTTTSGVAVNLGSTTQQVVNSNLSLKLSSSTVFEKAVGGSGNDTLTGNSLANTLTGNAGNDQLTGGDGNDSLFGGSGDDTYVFATATTSEADTVTEAANAGTDTLSFSTLTTDIVLNLGTAAVQTVHANRTLKLNSTNVLENIVGGSGHDTLTGNAQANILVGNSGGDTLNGSGGRDIVIGGLGLDTLNGGNEEDILIAGRTTSDSSLTGLAALGTVWTSADPYATRVNGLRAGVGSPSVSLKAKVNVLNDAGDDDLLIGAADSDWYFRALDDLITGLFAGEFVDVL
jgi:Ca2+-binding RTX toxin-like protein